MGEIVHAAELGVPIKPFEGRSLQEGLFAEVSILSLPEEGVEIKIALLGTIFARDTQQMASDELKLGKLWIMGEAGKVKNFRDGEVRVESDEKQRLYRVPHDARSFHSRDQQRKIQLPFDQIDAEGKRKQKPEPLVMKIGEAVDLSVIIERAPQVEKEATRFSRLRQFIGR